MKAVDVLADLAGTMIAVLIIFLPTTLILAAIFVLAFFLARFV